MFKIPYLSMMSASPPLRGLMGMRDILIYLWLYFEKDKDTKAVQMILFMTASE